MIHLMITACCVLRVAYYALRIVRCVMQKYLALPCVTSVSLNLSIAQMDHEQLMIAHDP